MGGALGAGRHAAVAVADCVAVAVAAVVAPGRQLALVVALELDCDFEQDFPALGARWAELGRHVYLGSHSDLGFADLLFLFQIDSR